MTALEVRDLNGGVALLAGVIHAVAHRDPRPAVRVREGLPTCNDCKADATTVLTRIVTPSAAGLEAERWPAARILPAGWVRNRAVPGKVEIWDHGRRGIRVIYSEALQADGRVWTHLSVSHGSRPPAWEVVREVKALFLGDAEAYMVFPPAARWVDINERVLHLFACRDEPSGVLPDFTGGTGSL